MTKNSDFFFVNLKKLYPNFLAPCDIDTEIWEELLEQFSCEDIRSALKTYRRSELGHFPPYVHQFKEFLYPYTKTVKEQCLPLSPETYLMEQDVKAGRCKHLFPAYVAGVQYVFNVKLKDYVEPAVFEKMNIGQRYRAAVDNGLFADFDKILEIVDGKGI